MVGTTKIAVVTGGSQGIGLGVCQALVEKGLHVILTARSEAATAKALKEIGSPANAEGRALDVADPVSVNMFYNWLFQKHGRIDVLVNNAARAYYDPSLPAPGFDQVDPETVLEAFVNNTMSAYRMSKWALPAMEKQDYGRIVNVSSRLASLAHMEANAPAYRISKVALSAVTVLSAKAAQGNIKINAIAPGHVRTAMGGDHAARSVEEGVVGIIWAATLPEDGPSGGFFYDDQPYPW